MSERYYWCSVDGDPIVFDVEAHSPEHAAEQHAMAIGARFGWPMMQVVHVKRHDTGETWDVSVKWTPTYRAQGVLAYRGLDG